MTEQTDGRLTAEGDSEKSEQIAADIVPGTVLEYEDTSFLVEDAHRNYGTVTIQRVFQDTYKPGPFSDHTEPRTFTLVEAEVEGGEVEQFALDVVASWLLETSHSGRAEIVSRGEGSFDPEPPQDD